MADFEANYLVANDEYLSAQSPSPAEYFSSSSVNVTTNVRYFQRVYDSGTAGWCYYSTLNALNPSPASADTSPNWTGAISDPQVLSVLAAP